MREKIKAYTIPLLVLFVEILVSLYFISSHRIPGSTIVQEWPSGIPTKTVPLWIVTLVMPILSIVTIAMMELSIRFPGPKKWRPEAWRLRGASGPVTDAFFLVMLLLHYLGLLNVSSHWTLNQGSLLATSGVAMGLLMIVIGNFQTKTSNVGLWALTPWKLENPYAKQKCQQFSSRVAILGGILIAGLNIVLAGSPPWIINWIPVYPVLLITLGLYALIYLVVAIRTWGIVHWEGSVDTMGEH